MTRQVAQPVEQTVEELEGEEPFHPFKGKEEQDLSPVRAAGPGPSRYTGTPRRIWLLTLTPGPGVSLEKLQLKEVLCDPANYPRFANSL